MFREILKIVLTSLEIPRSVSFQYDDVSNWPEAVSQQLGDSGILKRAENAQTVACDGCEEGCVEDVEFSQDSSGSLAAYVICRHRTDIGRVRVAPERLRTWVASSAGLAQWLALQLGSHEAVEEVVANRLWWLGGPCIGRRRADVFLAIGSTWPDANTVFADVGRLAECTSGLVLLPTQVPVNHPFGVGPRVSSVQRVTRFENGILVLDTQEVEAIVGKSRTKRIQNTVGFSVPPGTEWEQVVIEMVDDETALVSAGGLRQPRSFEEMGFADRRKNGYPDKLWRLLQYMSFRDGRLGWDDNVTLDDITKRKRQVSDLRRRLQSFFGITSDPFKPYKSEHAYQARFAITRAGQPR